MRTLTTEEIKKYGISEYGNPTHALLDKKKDFIFLTSDTLKGCADALEQMTPAHPKYNDMELVAIPPVQNENK